MEKPACENQEVCKHARVSLVCTNINTCHHALCGAYIIVISNYGCLSPLRIRYSILKQNEILESAQVVRSLSLTIEENTSYGWKASLDLRLLYLRKAFPLFLKFPLQESWLSAVPKWNSALGTYEGRLQELLIISKNNSGRQANGNDWVLALYGYSNHFYIFWFPPLMLNYLHVGIMMVYHWKY